VVDEAPFRRLYPYKGRYFQRGPWRLHFLDEGRGEPVLALHGNPTWSFFYRQLVPALSDRCRLIIPDHLGCGLSDVPPPARYGYRLADRIDDLEVLLEHLGLAEGLTFVLHDWGGPIGLGYAARHPARLRRLILLNTAAFVSPRGWRLPRPLALFRRPWIGPILALGFNAVARGAARTAARRRLPAEVLEGYLAPYNRPSRRVALLRFIQDIPLGTADASFPLLEEIERSLVHLRRIPVLICWGGRDFIFDAPFLARWRELLPEAEVRIFPEAGHYLLEDAAVEVLARMREFLTRTAPVEAVR